MIVDIAMLLLSLGLILLSCVMFVSAIECFGKALNLHQGIIGSIFAAIGTALPETIIPIIAILFTKGESAQEIGIGAIAGAPFMLGTLAFFVTGTAVIVNKLLGRRTLAMNVDPGCLSRDLLSGGFWYPLYSLGLARDNHGVSGLRAFHGCYNPALGADQRYPESLLLLFGGVLYGVFMLAVIFN